ncbi:radical SAM protein [Nitrosopumilus sp. b2]|uniref:radical SAM protein n=1 Tax=Nitrosopumilus sp. b2 TaxID=2109908 RepID=UPI0015F3567C|nr:radical SAM protein [Nitrosopumilus sp. b2]KAF6244925.1 hypothetical protein C6989_05970 [Nitrosopumilus sp. b2]
MYLTKYLIKSELDEDHFLMINTLSGAIDRFHKHALSDLELIKQGRNPTNKNFLNKLTERGYVFESKNEEDEKFNKLRKTILDLEDKERPNITICPTFSCNMGCGYCYEGEITSIFKKSLINPSLIIRSIKKIEEYLKDQGKYCEKPDLTLIGGEPLLPIVKNDVLEIFKKCASMGYKFSIITNGYFLDLFIPDFVKNKKSLKYIQITIDGPKQIHDKRRPLKNLNSTFDKISENTELALKAGLPIKLRTNVDLTNIAFLSELGKYIKSKNWNKYSNFKAYLSPLEDCTVLGIDNVVREDKLIETWLNEKTDMNNENLSVFDDSQLFSTTDMLESTLLEKKQKVLPRFRYCGAVKGKMFVLGADGLLYLCVRGIGMPEVSVGRFYPDFQIFNDKIHQWTQRDIGNINCDSCSTVSTMQGGGCALEAIKNTGDLNSCSCDNTEETIMNYVNLRKKLFIDKFEESSSSKI